MSEHCASFSVGQIVEHRLFGYRGAIVDVNATFQLTDEWYDEVARSRPPKDKPWYHVLVHDAEHMTYVAERNLAAALDPGPIRHPLVEHFFAEWASDRYRPRSSVN